jgi:NADP-dependent 3-hydroxy acid dehydrogenase YdfG
VLAPLPVAALVRKAARIYSTGPLTGSVGLITGASSGIGRAIALALARQGAQLWVVGRNSDTLAETVAAAREFSEVKEFEIDLTVEEGLKPLLGRLEKEVGRLDILVHSAGVIHNELMSRAHIENLDLQYATNVRAPYLLTQRLLPMLMTARGQVVFINSSVGLVARRPEVGQYAATKHALKAIADSLREEVNSQGIRVLTVYLGRTATPMQAVLHWQEEKGYQPEMLLQPEDVASTVVHALMLPATAEVTDISIRPMRNAR